MGYCVAGMGIAVDGQARVSVFVVRLLCNRAAALHWINVGGSGGGIGCAKCIMARHRVGAERREVAVHVVRSRSRIGTRTAPPEREPQQEGKKHSHCCRRRWRWSCRVAGPRGRIGQGDCCLSRRKMLGGILTPGTAVGSKSGVCGLMSPRSDGYPYWERTMP